MKLHGAVELRVSGETILREPSFWDRVKKKFGGEPDLRTDRRRAALEATAVVEVTRKALSRLGATNAVSLVIDDQVLFQDRDGNPDDLGDLFLAFSDHESVFGGGFGLLRLAVEHREVGLHLILEVIARTEHGADEPAARVVIAGRIADFEPRTGEDADAYRARVEPLTKDASLIEVSRNQFESFVDRVADAMRASMPEAKVDVAEAEALVTRPSRQPARTPAPEPTDPRYDPYDRYYPSPFDSMLSVMMWTSLLSFAMPPHVVVVNEHGDSLGSGHDAAALDGGGGDGGGGDGGGDGGGGDGGDGGGDFGGGDFGDFGDMF
jgi:uncharacterized membrane protein YgcG